MYGWVILGVLLSPWFIWLIIIEVVHITFGSCTCIVSWLENFFFSSCLWTVYVPNHQSKTVLCGWDLAEWLECLAVNADVATLLSSIPASSDIGESEGRQTKKCWITYLKTKNTYRLKPMPSNSICKCESCLQFSSFLRIEHCTTVFSENCRL